MDIDDIILQNRFHELDKLKHERCKMCNENFHYKLHKLKKKLYHKDMAFYEINGHFFIHYECLQPLIHIFQSCEPVKINTFDHQEIEVKVIRLCGRNGEYLTKINYGEPSPKRKKIMAQFKIDLENYVEEWTEEKLYEKMINDKFDKIMEEKIMEEDGLTRGERWNNYIDCFDLLDQVDLKEKIN
jgi:hypothetical protein